MKCPNCGNELEEGFLICEHCGTEIQIVPDFEPEVENKINETLNNLADVVEPKEEKEAQTEIDTEDVQDQKEKSKNKLLVIFCVCCIAIVLVLVTIISIQNYYNTSVAYQEKQAKKYKDSEEYEQSLQYLQRAIELGGDKIDILFYMSSIYEEMQEMDEYTITLEKVIADESCTEEESIKAYKMLIAFYQSSGNPEAIAQLLKSCSISQINEEFVEFSAQPPDFNYIEGSYMEVIPLKLMSSTIGTIYYTLDGTVPDETSEIYTAPIFLETGDYEITALFVNQYGVRSELAKSTYHIEVSAPIAPEVEEYSGTFNVPTMIHVKSVEDKPIYYTTDGSEPTIDSPKYTGFLPMQLGKTVYKFAAIDDNQVKSEVTSRTFELNLLCETTIDDAYHALIEYLVFSGKIMDANGTIPNSTSKFSYKFLYTVNIKDMGDFYIFSENSEDAQGVSSKTGNFYAIGIYSLQMYQCQFMQDKYGITSDALTIEEE